MLSKNNKLLLVFSLTLLVAGVPLGAWWLLHPLDVVTPKEKTRISGGLVDTKTRSPALVTRPAEAEPSKTGEPAQTPHVIRSSGSLATITNLRAKLQELKVSADIAEQQVRLNKANTPIEKVHAPLEMTLPALPPMQIPSTGATLPKLVSDSDSTRSREMKVVSVQGVAGALTAVIRATSGARMTISQGERFAGGIAKISRTGVVIRSAHGKALKNLTFE